MSKRAEHQAYCLEQVRVYDHDRFLALLLVPAPAREVLLPLYAFHAELEHIVRTVREPVLGEIRLQWWREAVEALYEGRGQGHEIIREMAHVFPRSGIEKQTLIALIDARARDLDPAPFPTMKALSRYADATTGQLLRISYAGLARRWPEESLAPVISDGGIAYGLTHLLSTMRSQGSLTRLSLLRDLPDTQAGSSFAKPSDARGHPGFSPVLAPLLEEVEACLARFYTGQDRLPVQTRPAFLPLALIEGYLKVYRRQPSFPFGEIRIPAFRRQWSLLRSRWRGRV